MDAKELIQLIIDTGFVPHKESDTYVGIEVYGNVYGVAATIVASAFEDEQRKLIDIFETAQFKQYEDIDVLFFPSFKWPENEHFEGE